MKINPFPIKLRSRIFELALAISFLGGVPTMSQSAVENGGNVNENAFAVTGTMDHQYGTNSIGIFPSTGRIRLGLSNTFDMDFVGVGIVDSQLSSDDLKLAKEIHDQLCKAVWERTPTDLQVDPMMNFSLRCTVNGKMEAHQGRLGQLPSKLAFLLDNFRKDSLKRYAKGGRAIVKFDVAVSDIQREGSKFLVSVKFTNSGHYAIKMATPDKWQKSFAERLSINGFREGGGGEWRADLAGLPVINKSDYPVETVSLPMGESSSLVTIPADSSVTYKLLAIPAGKVPKGTYDFSAIIATDIYADGVFPGMGRVNFVSDRTKSAHITFDADYPSTPDEWKDYEARQREKMSSQPVAPSTSVTEAGYYRKVSASGERGQFVVGLMKGEKTPSLERPFDHWVWDADRALPTWCKPGEACPRDGRWVARTSRMGSVDADLTHAELERPMRTGEIAPSLSSLGGIVSYHYWQWLGA
ncbi:hypothetical protein [Burkholderia vietnamiensis]|uniref:hypothetical protein n=1 Tax=Burkholderia vietnamiensis TaxID=60552 RepID=UPI001CF4D258|nr:hypothetical protein [Burkholderia vietnamiensis]MCA8183943.1 hypothetical protein [Burkholderia vietnamiensis]